MKRPSWSWRSSTSFTSKLVFLFVAVCQPPTSVPRPGRHGRTLLANWRQRGHVNSPLSTEKPWRTWSFWRKKKTEVNVDLYNFKLFKFQYLSFKIWLYSGLDYSYIYICHNFGFIYFVGLILNDCQDAQQFSYPQWLHVGLVAIYMQSVSTGLDIDTSIPTYWHRLQARTL